MSLHRPSFDDADWRPHPFALAVYIAGVALLAWSVYAYAQLPSGQASLASRGEPWRPAVSRWFRPSATGEQRVSQASRAPAGGAPAAP
jgi:hypothetical protein